MLYQAEIDASIRYLQSDEAIMTIREDAYWPKWNAPYWHMLLLKEMGQVSKIPEKMIREWIAKLNKIPLKIFQINPEDFPSGLDPFRDSPCHCQLGNVYQILAIWGIDVDEELPWIRPWFLRYQMADGGLNCDSDAYLVENEVPSSMVGTIAVFEAVLLNTNRAWTVEERNFLDLGAKFLIRRRLTLGSETKHNASERESANLWLQPCFPRFYLYDALRGLSALLKWSVATKQAVDPESIRSVVEYYSNRFPDGKIKIERQSFSNVSTIAQSSDGEWLRRQPATFFPLLLKVSEVGVESPYLLKQWAEIEEILKSQSELKELLPQA